MIKYLNFVRILIQLHYPSEVSGGLLIPNNGLYQRYGKRSVNHPTPAWPGLRWSPRWNGHGQGSLDGGEPAEEPAVSIAGNLPSEAKKSHPQGRWCGSELDMKSHTRCWARSFKGRCLTNSTPSWRHWGRRWGKLQATGFCRSPHAAETKIWRNHPVQEPALETQCPAGLQPGESYTSQETKRYVTCRRRTLDTVYTAGPAGTTGTKERKKLPSSSSAPPNPPTGKA